MEGFVIFLIAAVVLLIITATYSIPIINSVERAKARVDEALSNVDVALTRRYDQTSQLADACKAHMSHEHSIILDAASIRCTGKTVEEMQKTDEEITELLSQIRINAEAYPALTSSPLFVNLLKSIDDTEVNLQAARRLYNSNASTFNSARREIPTCFFARRYPEYDLFRAQSYKRELPTLRF